MDLAGWSRGDFEAIAGSSPASPGRASRASRIPLSALRGRHGGLARREPLLVMGPTLSSASGQPRRSRLPSALSVQSSRAPSGEKADRRAYLGRVESGTMPSATTVVVRPSGRQSEGRRNRHADARWRRRRGPLLSIVLDRQVDVALRRHPDPPPRRAQPSPAVSPPAWPGSTATLSRPAGATGSSRAQDGSRATRRQVLHRLDLATLAPDAAGHPRIQRHRPRADHRREPPRRSMPTAPTGTPAASCSSDDATPRTVAAGWSSDRAWLAPLPFAPRGGPSNADAERCRPTYRARFPAVPDGRHPTFRNRRDAPRRAAKHRKHFVIRRTLSRLSLPAPLAAHAARSRSDVANVSLHPTRGALPGLQTRPSPRTWEATAKEKSTIRHPHGGAGKQARA